MNVENIRLLKAAEIECRIGSMNPKGITLLLYKNARVDMRILDETFGIYNWKKSYQSINGNLFCTIEIWDEDKKQWISKQDVGTESQSEGEKGQASDASKRASVCIGIGRELYTAPLIWIPIEKVRTENKDGRLIVKDRFFVSDICYNEDREIIGLVVKNQKGDPVFTLEQVTKRETTVPTRAESGNSTGTRKGTSSAGAVRKTRELLIDRNRKALQAELERTGVSMETVLKRYGIEGEEQMTAETYEAAMRDLRKTKTKAA